MITLNERFSLHRDRYNWILVETYDGFEGKGDQRRLVKKTRESYHPWPDFALRWMCELQAQGAGSVREVIGLYTDAVELLKAEGVVTRGLASQIARMDAQAREQAQKIKQLEKQLEKLNERR